VAENLLSRSKISHQVRSPRDAKKKLKALNKKKRKAAITARGGQSLDSPRRKSTKKSLPLGGGGGIATFPPRRTLFLEARMIVQQGEGGTPQKAWKSFNP